MPPPYTPVAPMPHAWYGAPSLGLTYGAQNIARTSPKDGGGQHFTIIPLPAQPVDELTMQARADAIAATYSGLLMSAVDLYRLTVERNGFMSGILDTMAHGFLGLPHTWHGDPEMVAALMDIRDANGRITTPGDYARMHPENECAKIFSDGIGMGIGLGQYLLMCWNCDGVEWDRQPGPTDAHAEIETCERCGAKRHERPIGTRELYQLRWRDPRWLWRNTVTLQWYYTGRQAMLPITPGDGEWFLFQTVPDQDIWIHGPWALGTEAAIFTRDARYDMQAISATCAPAHVFQFKSAADPRTRADVDAQADNLRFQNKLTLPGEVTHEIHAATGGDGGYVGTADRITSWAQIQWEVKVTGIQQGTENGTGFANNGVLQRVSRERRAFYAGAWIRQIGAQGLRWWARDNFGGRPCPVGHIDTRSPEDKLAESKAEEQEGKALAAQVEGYAAAGYELEPAWIEERAQTKGVRIRVANRSLVSEDDRKALVLGAEGRAAFGLAPFGDQRDRATVADLLNAKTAAPSGGSPLSAAPAAPSAAPATPHPPPAAPDAPRLADDDADDTDDDGGDAARLAEAMNRHGMPACRHGRTGVCPRCGVRASYDIDTSGSEPRYRPTWRAIRARLGTFVVDPLDAALANLDAVLAHLDSLPPLGDDEEGDEARARFNPDQERDAAGRFGSGGGAKMTEGGAAIVHSAGSKDGLGRSKAAKQARKDSDSAKAASEKAKAGGSHEDAAKAHEDAAKQHREAAAKSARADYREAHLAAAKAHEQAAQAHRDEHAKAKAPKPANDQTAAAANDSKAPPFQNGGYNAAAWAAHAAQHKGTTVYLVHDGKGFQGQPSIKAKAPKRAPYSAVHPDGTITHHGPPQKGTKRTPPPAGP